MFGRKCSRCERKIEKDYLFCPYCGQDFRMERIEKDKRDYGFLGKDDFFMPEFNISNFSSIFNSLMKEFDKQLKGAGDFKEVEMGKPRIRKTGISINIATDMGGEPKIRVQRFGNHAEKPKEMIKVRELTGSEVEKFSKLPKKEAETSVRRLSNKLVYELEVPGVENIDDVIINKLENSVEIKAIAKDMIYSKLIPIKMPLQSYKVEKGILVLEFKA